MMKPPTLAIEARANGAVGSSQDHEPVGSGQDHEPWAVRSIVSDAHAHAREIITEAKEERDRILDQARAEVALERVRRNDSAAIPVTPVHSSEISAHNFPKTMRGLDEDAVYEWLSMVQTSHATLEDELDRLCAAWDEILIALTRLQSDPQGSSIAQAITAGRPDPRVSAIDTSASRETLTPPIRGVRQAQAALASARMQLARVQHRAALLQRSNEQLRTQLIETLTKACAK